MRRLYLIAISACAVLLCFQRGDAQSTLKLLGQGGYLTPCVVDTTTGALSGCVTANGVASVSAGALSVEATTVSNPISGTSSQFGPCTFTPSGSTTESAYVYAALGSSGITDGIHIKAATNSFTASGSGCTADSPAGGANPAGTTLLYTWPMTSGAFGAAATTDWRTQVSTTSIVAGTGLSLSGSTIGINTATVQQFGTVRTVSAASDSILDSDRNKMVVYTNAGAVSVSIAQAGGSGQFVSGWKTDIVCNGCGGITLTPTTSTVNGGASLSIPANVWAQVRSDGANYFAGTTQGAQGPTGPTGPVSNSGTLTLNNVIIGNGTTVVKDSGMAAPTGGFAGLNQTNTFASSAYNDEHSATTPHRFPEINGYAGTVYGSQAWYDPTQQTWRFGSQFSSSAGSAVPRLICSNVLGFTDQLSTDGATYNSTTSVNACPAGTCATNTQAGSAFASTCTLPANFFVASGKQLRVEVGYQFTAAATLPTLNLGIRLNNAGTRVLLASNAGQALATTGTFGAGAAWIVGVNAGPGASANVWAEPISWTVPLATSGSIRQAATVPAVAATNAQEALEFFCSYGAANAGNNTALAFYNVWEVN